MGVQVALAARHFGPVAPRPSNLDVLGADLHIPGYSTTDAGGGEEVLGCG